MKNFRLLFTLFSIAFTLFFTQQTCLAEEKISSAKEAIVDPNFEVDALSAWDVVSESSEKAGDLVAVGDSGLDFIIEMMTDEKFANNITPQLVKLLEKCPGLKGGWAKQLGALEKISGVLKVLDIAGKVSEMLVDSAELWKYYQAGDQEKFAEKLADVAIEVVAELAGTAAGKVVHTLVAEAATAAGVATGGVGGIIVATVGWGAGVYVEGKVSDLVEDLLKEHAKDFLVEQGKNLFNVLQDKEEDLSHQLPVTPPGGKENADSDSGKNTPVQLDKLKVYTR